MNTLARMIRQAATRWADSQPTPLVCRALEPWNSPNRTP